MVIEKLLLYVIPVKPNFVHLHDSSWYEQESSRSDAQEKLMSQPVGAFLIRGSRNATLGNFSVSVRYI